MNRAKTLFLTSIVLLLLVVSCSNNQKTADMVVKDSLPAPVLPQPFHFHKAIEVKPGLTFDVLSWGRGSSTAGAYLLLRSDSGRIKYRSVSGELDGKIQDTWNMDMDSDGNPEIFIQAKGEGEGSHFTMYVYEFDDNGSSQQLHFPDLSAATKKSYRGLDSVYIQNGKLRREFPLFKEDDQSNKPTGGEKILEYSLRSNTFSVQDLSPGATTKTETAISPQKEKPVQKTVQKKRTSSTKKKRRRR